MGTLKQQALGGDERVVGNKAEGPHSLVGYKALQEAPKGCGWGMGVEGHLERRTTMGWNIGRGGGDTPEGGHVGGAFG